LLGIFRVWPVYEVIVERLRKLDLAGATAFPFTRLRVTPRLPRGDDVGPILFGYAYRFF
jgi:hypothetical protein